MADKILLGKIKDPDNFGYRSCVSIEKHKWVCDWYWGFGYVGNSNLHYHFESFLKQPKLASELFETPKYSDSDWWVIRDLFAQAYALRKAAETYRYGGHQSSRKSVTDIIQNKELESRLNADLKIVLDTLWKFLEDQRVA